MDYEKYIINKNDKLFIEGNKRLVQDILSEFFSKTILSASKDMIANQLVNAYLNDKRGREFIEVLLAPKAIPKQFISQIPIFLRGNYKQSINELINTKVKLNAPTTIEKIRRDLQIRRNKFVKQKKAKRKIKPIKKKINIKIKR